MKTETKTPAEFIMPLTINKLHGRLLKIPAQKKANKRNILFLYGHHASLERVFSIAENLSGYGSVVVPDLPGFGGMDSFYTINLEPTLDAYADYLATFIKLQYKKQPITICAMSWGFVVATKCLQKYPELAKQVSLYISMVGFAHYGDIRLSKKTMIFWKSAATLGGTWLGSKLIRYTVLTAPAIKIVYLLQARTHPKMKDANNEELKRRINFEVNLWQANDVRTHFKTLGYMANINITDNKIDCDLEHIEVDSDQYFDNKRVAKSLSKIFNKVTVSKAHLPNHAPTIIDDAKAAGAILPIRVRKLLAKKVR
jgi:pimeloyl-ACP methyl ester carboxylesterase